MNSAEPDITGRDGENLPLFTVNNVLSPTLKQNLAEKGPLEGKILSNEFLDYKNAYKIKVAFLVEKNAKPQPRKVTRKIFIFSTEPVETNSVKVQLTAA